MQKLEDVIKEQYGTINKAAKATGTWGEQIKRNIRYGCIIDSKGEMYRSMGNINKDKQRISALEAKVKELGGDI